MPHVSLWNDILRLLTGSRVIDLNPERNARARASGMHYFVSRDRE